VRLIPVYRRQSQAGFFLMQHLFAGSLNDAAAFAGEFQLQPVIRFMGLFSGRAPEMHLAGCIRLYIFVILF